MRTETRPDTTILIVAFRNFLKARKNNPYLCLKIHNINELSQQAVTQKTLPQKGTIKFQVTSFHYCDNQNSIAPRIL